ncbi:flagellar basal-body rod protein FlgB [Nitrosomonas cryotolerans]|uniref:Flagellar basal body rod protein FlgB n=1 Tax=Nitrosomonas cryotolerans ATCC 49181 TaxID=1131553 RepID=A0A1N6IL50_9PROT|nr:flagellar basal body rod protein FlgB [Nitrosomonas cryotolerans]SFP37368.1 flagellar basal-body rod protein FlgB [Nitrosomonas cryotolerans]SIO32727.1 flagellar basal-body rod protein FlgB [Nitrosomonas cryotolerans ATCC 49181]
MINKLNNTLSFHHQTLNLRTTRQELLSSNIANADTPNFKAQDIDFSRTLRETLSSKNMKPGLATTSPAHIHSDSGNISAAQILYRVPQQPSADGNTVDMDTERTRFADNSIKYDASLTFISGQIKSLLSAIKE